MQITIVTKAYILTMCIRLLLTYIILIVFTPVTSSAKEVCPVGWFGEKCMFECHCSSGNCEHDGSCHGPAFCAFGFFGPGCQYADACSVMCTQDVPTFVRDSDDTTCNPTPLQTSITMVFTAEFVPHWIRIVVENPRTLHNFTVLLNYQNQCINERRYPVSNVSVDVYCDNTETLSVLQVTGDAMESVCSIYISGGRNVALKQQTWQSSVTKTTLTNYTAANAVDGHREDTITNYETCSKTTLERTPSWGIIYNRPQILSMVTLHNPNDRRTSLQKFSLATYNGVKVTNMYTRDHNMTFRKYFVPLTSTDMSLQLTIVASTFQVLELCEVETYGETVCPEHTYGTSCGEMCRCSVNESCSTATGACSTPCPAGTYGFKCSFNCSAHCSSGICKERLGDCYKCMPGYRGDSCTEACPNGTHGYYCMSNCSKYCTNTCDFISGFCDCKQGRIGNSCLECTVGHFGENCTARCPQKCKGGVCDSDTGVCTECPDGAYGAECTDTCPGTCTRGICNIADGSCIACHQGLYGPNCTMSCSRLCMDNECHITSGVCLACRNGQVPNCTACPTGTYGNNCNLSCPKFCKDGFCDIHLGQCLACEGNEILPFCDDVHFSVDPITAELTDKMFWLAILLFPLIALLLFIFFFAKQRAGNQSEHM